MQSNEQLHFLQHKISELGNAIFFNQSDAVLKFPTALISNPTVDDFGFVWFWVARPKTQVTEFEKGFPVRLDFYRKGLSCFLQVSGKAWVVSDPEELMAAPTGSQSTNFAMMDMVLIKVKMTKADYHETARASRHTWLSGKVHNIMSLFRSATGGYAAQDSSYFTVS